LVSIVGLVVLVSPCHQRRPYCRITSQAFWSPVGDDLVDLVEVGDRLQFRAVKTLAAQLDRTVLNGEEYRGRRSSQSAEGQRRRGLLVEVSPDADPQFIGAIAAAEQFWGLDEQWRQAIGAMIAVPAGTSAALPEDVAPVSQVKTGWRVLRWRGRKQPAAVQLELRVDDGPVDPSFLVPRPGVRRQRVGGLRSWVARLALVTAPLFLIGGVAYSCGVSDSADRVVASSAITPAEASAYHLSTFPAAQAAAFGVTYLTLCSTHPAAADTRAVADRLTVLARMASGGVAVGCGWDGTGAAQQPVSVVWTGATAPASGTYSTGSAAQMVFTVALSDRRIITITVPVWASTNDGQPKFRIVGGCRCCRRLSWFRCRRRQCRRRWTLIWLTP